MTSALLPTTLVFRAFTQAGNLAPLAGGILSFFVAGTSTPQAVYTDSTGTVPIGNQIALDANGQAAFWLKSGLAYKINLTDSLGVQQAGWPLDGIVADPTSAVQAALLAQLASSTPGQGASLVDYDLTQTYAPGTVGYGIGALTPAFQAADALVTTAFQAGDATVTAAFQAADTALSTRVSAVEIGQASSLVGYATQALLYADLVPADKSIGYVTNDSTPANNGTYRKSGATGTGSWIQSSYDRVAIVETKAMGIGTTYAYLSGDGATTAAYLQRNHPDDVLTKSGGWEGTQPLYSTARTNILANSEDATAWSKGTGVTVTANAIAAPNGAMTADLVDVTSAAVGAGVNPMTLGATPGVPLIHSIWLKGFSGGEQIWIYDGATGVTPVIATLTTAWQKFTLAVTPSGSAAGPWVQKAAAGTNKFYVWGADSKSGVLSSYIKTTGSPATVTDYTLANNLVTLATAPAMGETVKWVPVIPDITTTLSNRATALETVTAGIGTTFDKFVGNGSATTAYLMKPTTDSALYSTNTWQGDQKLYPTVRTNLHPWSQDMTHWTPGASVVVTGNATTAPDGTTTASLIDTRSAAALTGVAINGSGATISEPYIESIWMKGYVGGEHVRILDSSSASTPTDIYLTTTWTRYSVNVTPTGSFIGLSIQSWDACRFYAWGANAIGTWETPYLSSYIPTPSASAVAVTDYSVGTNNLVTFTAPRITGDTIYWKDPNSFYVRRNSAGILKDSMFDVGNGTSMNAIVGSAMNSDVSGHFNSILGMGAMQSNTTGYTNVAVGTLALSSNTTGSGLVAVGSGALIANTTGYYNTAIGDAALAAVTTGQWNVAIGGYAGTACTGTGNIFLGNRAGTYQVAVSNTLIIDSLWRADAATELANSPIVGLIGQATSQAQWIRFNSDHQIKHRLQILGKALTANGATTTFTYPESTRYQYITTSAASLAVTLPTTSAAVDGLVITFVAGSAVAAATWVAGTGGATIVGAPATLVANVPVRMIYHHATTQWLPY